MWDMIKEPSEITIGTKVFRGVPASLRPMDPKLDVGVVVDFGMTPGIVWVELQDVCGKKVRTPLPVANLEAIG